MGLKYNRPQYTHGLELESLWEVAMRTDVLSHSTLRLAPHANVSESVWKFRKLVILFLKKPAKPYRSIGLDIVTAAVVSCCLIHAFPLYYTTVLLMNELGAVSTLELSTMSLSVEMEFFSSHDQLSP